MWRSLRSRSSVCSSQQPRDGWTSYHIESHLKSGFQFIFGLSLNASYSSICKDWLPTDFPAGEDVTRYPNVFKLSSGTKMWRWWGLCSQIELPSCCSKATISIPNYKSCLRHSNPKPVFTFLCFHFFSISCVKSSWLCEAVCLDQNKINQLINKSGCSMCFKVCCFMRLVPAFGGLSVKVIILIHLRRLQWRLLPNKSSFITAGELFAGDTAFQQACLCL